MEILIILVLIVLFLRTELAAAMILSILACGLLQYLEVAPVGSGIWPWFWSITFVLYLLVFIGKIAGKSS